MTQLVFIIPKDELEQTIRKVMNEQNQSKPVIDISEKMDRKQAAKFLGVSYTTMYNWLKDGILKEHGHARKKYFLRSELIESMQNNG
ncbi:MAG: helix-turn-helix domain-containing protein [Bacteroidota bacterium]|nr:helix-turn-helix domain-containing protein [Bacteroidota bacterium]